MKYLSDNSAFLGTGEKNQDGLTLDEFLEEYDPKKYDSPCNTVDMIVLLSEKPFRSFSQPLKLLMIRRRNHPNIGKWALPGGFVELKENLDTAAARELEEETGVTDVPLVQLATWGDYDRDPRWHIITTSFLALIDGSRTVKAGDDAQDAVWMDVRLEKQTVSPPTGSSEAKRVQGEDGSDFCTENTEWSLTLEEKSRNLCLKALVTETRTRQGILPVRKYQVKEMGGIAADHSALILQALLYLKEICLSAEM